MASGFHWNKEDYFPYLIKDFKQAVLALEYLVDDLHSDKDKTIDKFLNHCGSEDFLWGLIKLMSSDNLRVSGNSAYVFGTIAETASGVERIIGLLQNEAHPDSKKILGYLVSLLRSSDYECLMNAAGTIGTISESNVGREWLITQPLLDEIIELSTNLLSNQNIWVSSNAALVLARISIEDNGCEKLLKHHLSKKILNELINSLGSDNAGRGMNCAFAIGRICDNENGRLAILKLAHVKKLIESLGTMIEQNMDNGCTKNACFALSCLAANQQAHQLIVDHACFESLLGALCDLLSKVKDAETQWFAAMLLRIFSGFPAGCIKMKGLSFIWQTLKNLLTNPNLYSDVKEEIELTLETLKPLEKPSPVRVTTISPSEVLCEWNEMKLKNKLKVHYLLCKNNECIYNGPELSMRVNNLAPFTLYTFTLQVLTVENGEKSAVSEPVHMTTEEDLPSEPLNLKCVGATSTLLKIVWEPPERANGLLRGYSIYNGTNLVDQTNDHMCIIGGLQAATAYEISVCASTSKGRGARATLRASTGDMGDILPEKPWFGLVGKREILVRWQPPQVITGKLNRYELLMNGKCVYSGISCEHQVIMLKPDTDYKFEVIAITTEGKCRSKVSKARTLREEYDPERPPLYPGATSTNLLNKEKTEANLERKRSSLTLNRENTKQLYLIRQKTKHKLSKEHLATNVCDEFSLDANNNINLEKKSSITSLTNKFLPPVNPNPPITNQPSQSPNGDANGSDDVTQLNSRATPPRITDQLFNSSPGNAAMLSRGRSFIEKSKLKTQNSEATKNFPIGLSNTSKLNRSKTFMTFNSNSRKNSQNHGGAIGPASTFLQPTTIALSIKELTPSFPSLPLVASSSIPNINMMGGPSPSSNLNYMQQTMSVQSGLPKSSSNKQHQQLSPLLNSAATHVGNAGFARQTNPARLNQAYAKASIEHASSFNYNYLFKKLNHASKEKTSLQIEYEK